ncbi:hypothetical protein Goari_002426, partial [Gossypium aridum]|nr:hypothetical protein [Gossypium aridum]
EYIEEKVSPDEKIPWTKVHIEKGFEALEKLLKDHARRYATGDEGSLGEFGWAVRLPTVSVKTTVAVRLDTVTIL